MCNSPVSSNNPLSDDIPLTYQMFLYREFWVISLLFACSFVSTIVVIIWAGRRRPIKYARFFNLC